jgi:hypothetical protein
MSTIRTLATELGVSVGTVMNLKRDGMPTELAEAKAWYALRATNRRAFKTPGAVDPNEIEADALENSLPRIRRLEKAVALAAERAFKEGNVAEAISLRREHVGAIKTLYEAESKLIKINEARGKLISVDRALSLINEALQSAILVLRRLPEMGRDADERRRLEAFMNGVLAELKTGAADGLKHAA